MLLRRSVRSNNWSLLTSAGERAVQRADDIDRARARLGFGIQQVEQRTFIVADEIYRAAVEIGKDGAGFVRFLRRR